MTTTFEQAIEHTKQMEKIRLSPEGILKHKRDTAILYYSIYNRIKYSEAKKLFEEMRW
jgi:hypothetical protein